MSKGVLGTVFRGGASSSSRLRSSLCTPRIQFSTNEAERMNHQSKLKLFHRNTPKLFKLTILLLLVIVVHFHVFGGLSGQQDNAAGSPNRTYVEKLMRHAAHLLSNETSYSKVEQSRCADLRKCYSLHFLKIHIQIQKYDQNVLPCRIRGHQKQRLSK